jgi:hypothetical protein
MTTFSIGEKIKVVGSKSGCNGCRCNKCSCLGNGNVIEVLGYEIDMEYVDGKLFFFSTQSLERFACSSFKLSIPTAWEKSFGMNVAWLDRRAA